MELQLQHRHTEDFIRLHVLALEDFDAVAYYDADCEFQVCRVFLGGTLGKGSNLTNIFQGG